MSKYLFLLACAAVSVPLSAQDTVTTVAEDAPAADDGIAFYDPVATVPDQAIVVVASGISSHRTAQPYPVSVIGDAELRQIQGPDLTRALRRLPGVTLTRNGGQGGFTGVRVRGAGAEQLLVLVDGVKVNDVSAPGGGFDFGNLSAEEIGKVELLRGAHSLVWGSDALAGVMNLSTRRTDGLLGSVEYGGARQFTGQASAGFDSGSVSGGLAGGYVHARGISSAAGGSERDGYTQWNLAGRARAALAEGWALTANGRYAEGELDIDGYPAPLYAFADTLERQDTQERSGRVGIERTGGPLSLRAGVAHSANDRDLFDDAVGPVPYYETRGRLTRAELFGEWRAGDLRFDFGGTREWSRFAANSAFAADRGTARTRSGHAMLTLDRGDLTLGGGARYDHHDRFGGAWTFGANGSVELAPSLLLRASYGEGFKAPTLFQLLSDYGNAVLRPEQSRSYDLGLELARGPVTAALSLFRRDSRDLIDFVSCFGTTGGICAGRPFGTYDNVGRARAEGFEVELGARPVQGVALGAAYSYVKARDRTAGTDLARRPRHALTLSGDWTVDPRVVFSTSLGADLRMVGDSFDDAGNFTRIDGHALLDLRASRPILMLDASRQRTLDLFGRIENVTDARYTEVAGYATQGRTAYIGLRAKL